MSEPERPESEGPGRDPYPQASRRASDEDPDHDSSRLTADDAIPGERREEARRVEDRVRIDALQKRYASYRRIALRAVTAWAIVGTIAAVGLLLADVKLSHSASRARAAANKATDAADKATRALALADRNTRRLVSNGTLACHRLNVLRVIQVDQNAYREWRFDQTFLRLVAHPLVGSPKATAVQKRAETLFLAPLRAVVNDMTWTPATRSCDHPRSGAAPIRFATRQPRPSDLTLKPGQ